MSLGTIELQFGPSDQDREAWLAARRLGITATEVRDLYIGKITQRELIDLKLGRRKDSFAGNAYTRWGTEREPVIAALIQERYAIAPETRLVHAADNPRFLYSPDGVGIDFDGELVLSEIKTSGKPIPTNSDDFAKKGYRAQMAWGIRVTGAQRILYAWEQRLGDPVAGFQVGSLFFEWIEREDVTALIGELEQIATDFLAALDAAAAEPFVEQEVDELLDTLALNVLTGRAQEAKGKRLKEAAWADLQMLLAERGEDFHQESLLTRITYTPASAATSEVPDQEAAIEAEPVLWRNLQRIQEQWAEHAAKFTKKVTTTTKASLTVTAVKQKGTKQ